MTARDCRHDPEAGFTLIEALVALALTGLVLSALTTLTAQFLPNWNRGIDRIQQSGLVAISLQRIAADLAAAEFIPAGGAQAKLLFDGAPFSVTFVRTAIGPNAGIGLDVVRIGETADGNHLLTVRTSTPYTPLPARTSLSERLGLKEPVVLLRAPLRLTFAYAGSDKVFHDDWHDSEKLPIAIQLTVRDITSQRVLAVSTVAPVHVNASTGKPDDDGADPNGDARNDGSKPVSGGDKRGRS
ncbi:prepilin-type N-terminal cleavage/methylation domain-containing protein [Bradyrhizobium sp. KB893862 SZCCT0404]|uniref:PulJ/GspJ family protein n=1 Tax=Bradyrhizobium sp. KB893862 SZCCT0404 TaxID=2807672 RepID=UPI001BACE722|nr:prepilin-type N-terminal cleavage/methylation domain-containing protein [Bradyrhizobium sp. KB893862 SZCCT0404]MBR1175259.1 prepilin-type N-terminal cleavage/methylation domain-containing protein [Bradyrhizobium sp. KB893862 SZCCT0404]